VKVAASTLLRSRAVTRKNNGEVGTSMKDLLKDVEVEKPKPEPKSRPSPPAPPSTTARGDDRTAFMDAMAGVRPLKDKGPPPKRNDPRARRPAPPAEPSGDVEARARLAALVGGGVRFEVERDDELVRGWRVGTPARAASALTKRGVVPEATVDLHGMTADEAERVLVRFLRAQHRRGVGRVCVVHGKGLHSEGGVGVLRDRAIHAITDGGGAPVVAAFATAPASLGGSGALMVQLTR